MDIGEFVEILEGRSPLMALVFGTGWTTRYCILKDGHLRWYRARGDTYFDGIFLGKDMIGEACLSNLHPVEQHESVLLYETKTKYFVVGIKAPTYHIWYQALEFYCETLSRRGDDSRSDSLPDLELYGDEASENSSFKGTLDDIFRKKSSPISDGGKSKSRRQIVPFQQVVEEEDVLDCNKETTSPIESAEITHSISNQTTEDIPNFDTEVRTLEMEEITQSQRVIEHELVDPESQSVLFAVEYLKHGQTFEVAVHKSAATTKSWRDIVKHQCEGKNPSRKRFRMKNLRRNWSKRTVRLEITDKFHFILCIGRFKPQKRAKTLPPVWLPTLHFDVNHVVNVMVVERTREVCIVIPFQNLPRRWRRSRRLFRGKQKKANHERMYVMIRPYSLQECERWYNALQKVRHFLLSEPTCLPSLDSENDVKFPQATSQPRCDHSDKRMEMEEAAHADDSDDSTDLTEDDTVLVDHEHSSMQNDDLQGHSQHEGMEHHNTTDEKADGDADSLEIAELRKRLATIPAVYERASQVRFELNRECLSRYLMICHGASDLALDRLLSTIKWREELQITKLTAKRFIDQAAHNGLFVEKADRYAVLYVRCSNPSPPSLEYLVYTMERAMHLVGDSNDKSRSIIVLIDCTRVSRDNLPSMSTLRVMGRVLGDHYAKCLHSVLVMNAPSFVQFLWKAVSRFLPGSTRKRFAFLPQSPKQIRENGSLERYLPAEVVRVLRPDFGGPNLAETQVQSFQQYLEQCPWSNKKSTSTSLTLHLSNKSITALVA